MSTATLAETRDRTWSPLLDAVRAPALDCLQTSLALLAEHHHGPGAHLALGARSGFAVRWGPPPSLETPAAARLAEAAALAGLHVTERREGLDGPAVRGFAADAGVLYVLADAFAMRWTPYHGLAHLEHSFLLQPDGGRWKVIDGYHNETARGVARPGVWRLTADDLDEALRGGATALTIAAGPRPVLDPAAILAANAATFAAAAADVERYLAAVRAGVTGPDPVAPLDQLVLDVWLAGRARLLHAAWLATVPGLAPASVAAAEAQAERWLRLAGESYVALRRAQRGAEIPLAVLDGVEAALRADVTVAAEIAAGLDPVRTAVEAAVRAVLQVDDETLAAAASFRDLPNFNSFRLVDIVERVESQLGVELAAEALTSAALHDLTTLTGAFKTAFQTAQPTDREADR
ncbi:acyl carrier protein [Dactylosporangium roseum]|uniref:Acyl carrier protein n=1 Tax=Dactylosporangium roseum TaxID=47989 RepID=A0ABY5ZBT4_9ACTN|nr:acyl carrier protein [Dactylosporangium roseum]UWZ39576.1 acyl carrier protein [Dactylosporangium roseum]